jgi:hypothetical protein
VTQFLEFLNFMVCAALGVYLMALSKGNNKFCRIGVHPWGKWMVIRQGTYVADLAVPPLVEGHYVYMQGHSAERVKAGLGKKWVEQQRECAVCGKIQLRSERA